MKKRKVYFLFYKKNEKLNIGNDVEFFYIYAMKLEQLYSLYAEHFKVETDTRKDLKNAIFFALKGDNFNGNLFAELMETVKYCSLGQITHALYEVGGQYRRSM